MDWEAKVLVTNGPTDERSHEYIKIPFQCIRPSAWNCSLFRNCHHMPRQLICFNLLFLIFNIRFTDDFICEFEMSIVRECQNTCFLDCAVS